MEKFNKKYRFADPGFLFPNKHPIICLKTGGGKFSNILHCILKMISLLVPDILFPSGAAHHGVEADGSLQLNVIEAESPGGYFTLGHLKQNKS